MRSKVRLKPSGFAPYDPQTTSNKLSPVMLNGQTPPSGKPCTFLVQGEAKNLIIPISYKIEILPPPFNKLRAVSEVELPKAGSE